MFVRRKDKVMLNYKSENLSSIFIIRHQQICVRKNSDHVVAIIIVRKEALYYEGV